MTAPQPPSIDDRLSLYKGITSGFDYLRLFLAIAVMFIHAPVISSGTNPIWEGPFRGLGMMILPMFFTLSGFLVSASLHRNSSLATFLTFRAVRLLPALAVEVTLSALLLGPLLTTLPLQDYFSSSEFWPYFLNILGDIHYTLPGVFDKNPFSGIVNGSLWTIPYELDCYLALILIFLTGILRHSVLFLFLMLDIIVGYTVYLCIFGTDDLTAHIGPTGPLLVMSFLTGVLFFDFRKHIPLNRTYFLCALLPAPFLLGHADWRYAAIPLVTYVTVYLGLQNPAKRSFLLRGDYSYGVYLFAFPTQQTVMHLFPTMTVWWFNLLLAIPATIGIAYISWHYVEARILARKKLIAQIVWKNVNNIYLGITGKSGRSP